MSQTERDGEKHIQYTHQFVEKTIKHEGGKDVKPTGANEMALYYWIEHEAVPGTLVAKVVRDGRAIRMFTTSAVVKDTLIFNRVDGQRGDVQIVNGSFNAKRGCIWLVWNGDPGPHEIQLSYEYDVDKERREREQKRKELRMDIKVELGNTFITPDLKDVYKQINIKINHYHEQAQDLFARNNLTEDDVIDELACRVKAEIKSQLAELNRQKWIGDGVYIEPANYTFKKTPDGVEVWESVAPGVAQAKVATYDEQTESVKWTARVRLIDRTEQIKSQVKEWLKEN